MRKTNSTIIILIGTVLFFIGLFTKVPSKELTTHSALSDNHSVIEEYVGGDAYNYIIGASLIGGEISGAKTQKAVFISIGLLILSIGLLSLSRNSSNKLNENNETAIPSNLKDDIYEINDDTITNITDNTLITEVDKSFNK